MTKPLNEVSHCVYNENGSSLSIWWVDDCFTNRSVAEADGGFLPFEDVKNDKVDEALGSSAFLYQMFYTIATAQHLSFHICSFEYAEVNWGTHLNSSRNLVLLDIQYQGKGPQEEKYGIDLFYRWSQHPVLAMVAFLTIQPNRVAEWVNDTGTTGLWLANVPPTITKFRDGKPPDAQVRKLVSEFKKQQPQMASELEVETWNRLRKKAREVCVELGRCGDERTRINHGEWAHHLPCGGQKWDSVEDDRIRRFTATLRDKLESISPAVEHWPDHCWDDNSADSWDKPPVRALAQVDSEGKDLSTLLYLLRNDIRSVPLIKLNALFAPSGDNRGQYPLRRDYMWFNACALARGLLLLAKGFSHIVSKIRDANGTIAEEYRMFQGVECRGRVFWYITESLSNGEPGLRVQIHQDLFGRPQRTEKRPLIISPFDLPSPNIAEKTVATAYRYFYNAGASDPISWHSDGSVVVWIPAKIVRADGEDK